LHFDGVKAPSVQPEPAMPIVQISSPTESAGQEKPKCQAFVMPALGEGADVLFVVTFLQ
jgi:hypothetical protein